MSKKLLEDMTSDELREELRRTREYLEDYEEMHAFTFTKTSVHISATKVDEIQKDHEDETKEYKDKINEIERLLRERGEIE